ncbi:hypothetical protein CFP56_026038 [Quercus suber]|uniref:Uncharacterized protein n=1 Tax=Quercus suber TaxID=58331 RepID=A0AAW0K198_QUESU
MKSLLEVKGFSWDEIYPLQLSCQERFKIATKFGIHRISSLQLNISPEYVETKVPKEETVGEHKKLVEEVKIKAYCFI